MDNCDYSQSNGKPQIDSEIDRAKYKRDVAVLNLRYSNQRENENADLFSGSQLQIAGIFLALSATVVTANVDSLKMSPSRELFISALVSLMLSLVFGVINFYKKRSFWFSVSKATNSYIFELNQVVEGDTSLMHAESACQKAYGNMSHATSPAWPWMIQSALLMLGLLAVVVSVTISLYH